MQKTLTVTAVNFKNVVTSYSKTFDTTRISGVIANPNTGDIPAITGTTRFEYQESVGGQVNVYHVSEAVEAVANALDNYAGDAATGVTAEEFGDGIMHKTVLTIDEFTQAVAGAALAFGKKLYDFPEGLIRVFNYVIDITVTGATSTDTPEVGLGTATGTGANATLGAVGATAEDIADGTAMGAIASTGKAYQASGAAEADAASLDGHTTAKDLYLNFADTWTVSEDLTISGTVTILWAHIGDY